MRISLIAAYADARVIGIDNRLPWHLPADMKHFRALTMGKPVVMGRKTFESIGKPLPGRHNIVVSRDPRFTADGCTVVGSIEEALRAAANAEEVMIIGGASLYEQTLPRADRLYLTLVHAEIAGDAWFPAYDEGLWQQLERREFAADEANSHPYTFLTLERRRD